MTYLETHITLPPGALPAKVVREIVETAVRDFGWLKLERFGRSEPDTAVSAGETAIDAALAIYEQRQRLAVATAKKDAILQFLPDRTGAASHLGEIIWFVKPQRARDAAWREAHAIQVADVMYRVNSPYGFAALDEDIQRKTMREVETEQGTIRTHTVRTYADGLSGLFWRNFFAGPFLQMFGKRLTTLPADASRQLAHGVRLIQPYAAPEDARAAEGAARETALIEHLDAGAFYDRARHAPPTVRPPFPVLPATE